MGNILRFMKLDLITIKPYVTVKNLVIYLTMALFMAFGSQSPSAAIFLMLTFTVLYATYPFAVGDQNGIDGLYTVLGIERKTVVQGRYGFLLLMGLIGAAGGLVTYLLLTLALGADLSWGEVLTVLFSSLLVISLLQLIQYPLFFKNGYLKSKNLSYLPFLFIGLGSLLLERIFKYVPQESLERFNLFVAAHTTEALLLVVGFWLLCLVASYRLSYRYYVKREF